MLRLTLVIHNHIQTLPFFWKVWTINNAGNIISTAGSTVIVYVPTAITNSGLIDANTSTGNSVYTVWFHSGSDTSSLNNSGTIFSDHSVDRLIPTAAVSISTVNLDESFDKTRPVLSFGIDKFLAPTKKISATYQYQKLPYRNMSEKNLYLNYSFGF